MAENRTAATPVILLLLAIPLMLVACERDADPIAERQEGDVTEAVAGMDPGEQPDLARGYLATDRPWRAAMVMRAYFDAVDDPPADMRVLAARAEGGWGGWDRVRDLLEGVPGLDAHEHGIGLYLLGRARDEAGDPAGAVEAYRAFLALSPPAGELQAERNAARLRLGLALVRAGDRQAASRELAAARQLAGGASMWIDLLEAEALAATGNVAAVDQAVARHTDGMAGLRAWRARIEAARQAGDLRRARELANQGRNWARTAATRAEFFVLAGQAAVDLGDEAAGRGAYRSAIAQGAATPAARLAADLLREGRMSAADHLAVARVYRAQGLHVESIEGYRHWLASGEGAAGDRARVQMELANALFYSEQYAEAIEALRPISSQTAARQLIARSEAHRNNVDEAVRIYLSLAEAAGASGTGAQMLLLAAGARHDSGDMTRAAELYRRLIARHPGTSQMALSMMRLAGIHYLQEEYADAARIWDDYRQRFPRGDLALQATYWAGRAREARGDAAGAATLYRSIRQRDRSSYYALLASERLGEPFWPGPMSPSPATSPEAASRVAGWMAGIDLLRAAGFPDDASAQADRVVAAAGGDRLVRYALAEALAERGYSQRAIRMGLDLQRREARNRRLLRILYPFPYRTLITEEARDRNLEEFVTAALIRQESMFEERITSPAGARGLMQIMPATGRRLAEAAGMDAYHPDVLYHAEINVHLGTRYVAQHMASFDDSLPSVFSAYNAGAHRVEWWSAFPEYGREELFTERIPFRETRDYVKILTTNLAIYRGLYGEEE